MVLFLEGVRRGEKKGKLYLFKSAGSVTHDSSSSLSLAFVVKRTKKYSCMYEVVTYFHYVSGSISGPSSTIEASIKPEAEN